MAEKKEPLKTRDPYKYNRNVHYGLMAGKWASVVAPFIGIFIAKFGEYIEVYEGTQYKFTIGCVICLIVAVIAAYKDIKKTEGANSPISTAIGWGVAFMLSFLFKEIITDLTLVLGLAFAGQCGATTCEMVDESKKKYLTAYKDAKINAQAQADVQAERRKGTRY